jgi:hypothetical protein
MKDITECRSRLHGIFNIAVTPFHADGSFDYEGLAANIERVIALGYDGILIGGTYGEFPAMSADERAELFRRVMAIVGDRVPVMLCSAASDVRLVRDLTSLAGDLGGRCEAGRPLADGDRPDCQSPRRQDQAVLCIRSGVPRPDDGRLRRDQLHQQLRPAGTDSCRLSRG